MVNPRVGGSFLGDARGRLLPVSLPFRFFGAAAVFHALAWPAFGWSAWTGSPWGGALGWSLAALHLVTLGTLLSSAIGASLQLLPVATRQPVRRQRLIALLWWLYVPALMVLVVGMGLGWPALLATGGAGVIVAVLLWLGLLIGNLTGSRGMPGVVLHGWGAAAATLVVVTSAAALLAWWSGLPWIDRDLLRALHGVAGPFGLMGLLSLGLAYILLPMFALAHVPSEQRQLGAGALAAAALVLALAAPFTPPLVPVRGAALLAAGAALAWHLGSMRQVLAQGMRRDLGGSLLLMRIGWSALVLALACAAWWLQSGADAAARLWVPLVVVGWLLSFLMGVLQRIVPFLAAMHAARGQRRPPTPSSLTFEPALRVHLVAHGVALALLLAAALVDSTELALLASLAGSVGGVAFAVFFAVAALRLRRAFASAGAAGR